MRKFSYPYPSAWFYQFFWKMFPLFYIPYQLGDFWRMILNLLSFCSWLFKIDREVKVGVYIIALLSWCLAK